jgi:exonuclease SbcD
MKILHTSDWHLGHRFLEQSQAEEQKLFLDWLTGYIDAEHIDILLITGDIFDTGLPSTQSLKMYYDFLINIRNTKCKHIVITAGNHDSPGNINAPKDLLNALSIYVVGKTTENIEDEVFKFSINNQEIIIAAVPFLRDQDIRRAVAGETFEQIEMRYKTALINHYNNIAKYCNSINNQKSPVIATGHLFAVGGKPSDSEQFIYVGNLGDIAAGDFPDTFDYIALGHLHRPQKVANKENIRYSGSPVILSFSELNYDKKIIEIEIENNHISQIKEITVPKFRNIYRIEGNIDEIIVKLKNLSQLNNKLIPWVEVVINSQEELNIDISDIQKTAEQLNIEVLKIIFKKKKESSGLENLIYDKKDIKELTPEEIFIIKCKEENFDLENNPEIRDAFFEAYSIAKEI